MRLKERATKKSRKAESLRQIQEGTGSTASTLVIPGKSTSEEGEDAEMVTVLEATGKRHQDIEERKQSRRKPKKEEESL